MALRYLIAAAILTGCSATALTSEDREPNEPCETVECIVDAGLRVYTNSGVDAAIDYVATRAEQVSPANGGLCHDGLHRLGRTAGSRGEIVVSSGALVQCSGGFVHGLFVGYGATEVGIERMVRTCSAYIEEESLLCRHGYGHAIADTVQSIDDIRAACDSVAEFDAQASIPDISINQLCADGAFMEVASQIRYGTWSELIEHPVAACSELEGDTAWGCWRHLPSGFDDETIIKQVAARCASLTTLLVEACATGVAIAEITSNNPPRTSWCGYLTEARHVCEGRLVGQREG